MAFLAKLRPMGPWRAGPDSGERSRASAILHSDALYSALTHAMLQLGMLEPWIAATAGNAAGSSIRFSSCFPFVDQHLFVLPPRTLWPLPASLRVRWKSAKFVPTSMVAMLLNGRSIREDDWTVDGPSECLLPVIRGQVVSSPFRPALRSAAAVDRLGAGVEPHRTACIEFQKNAGIWIAFDFTDSAARDCWSLALKGALRLLADTGLGGERSRGWGRFEQPEFTEGPLARLLFGKQAQAITTPTNASWLLSLFSPAASDTVDWQLGSYAVALRSGRVESPAAWGAIKKTSRVIAEGSVLVSASPLQGAAKDVAPEGFAHPVYRAGFALALPIAAKRPELVVVEEAADEAADEAVEEASAEDVAPADAAPNVEAAKPDVAITKVSEAAVAVANIAAAETVIRNPDGAAMTEDVALSDTAPNVAAASPDIVITKTNGAEVVLAEDVAPADAAPNVEAASPDVVITEPAFSSPEVPDAAIPDTTIIIPETAIRTDQEPAE